MMMKKLSYYFSLKALVVILLAYTLAYPQNQESRNYSNSGYVHALATEGNYIWAGTSDGLVKIDKISSVPNFYDKSNSGLPDNDVRSIAIDGSGNVWIGTCGGLAKYDGTNWTTYTTSNSGLPDNQVMSIAIDRSDNKWIGCYTDWTGIYGGGLVKFDGTNWTIYNPSNSGLLSNFTSSIAIDDNDNEWLGTDSGLVRFDGTNWKTYTKVQFGLAW